MKGEELLVHFQRHAGRSVGDYWLLNQAYEHLARRSGMWLSRVRDEHSLVFKQSTTDYQLPKDRIRSLESVALKENSDEKEWRKLREVSWEEFDEVVLKWRLADGTDDEDTPTVYTLSWSEDKPLRVAPTPDGEFEGRLIYTGIPTPLDREVEPILPGLYHSLIPKLAAAWDLQDRGDEASLVRGRNLEKQVNQDLWALTVDSSSSRSDMNVRAHSILRTRSREGGRSRILRT